MAILRMAAAATFAAILTVSLVTDASATDGADEVIDQPISVVLDGSVLDAHQNEGVAPETAQEARAVSDYLANQDAGGYLTADDLEVATIPVADDVSITLVTPVDGAQLDELGVVVDDTMQDLTAVAHVEEPANTPQVAGPGMGDWPSWSSLPIFGIRMKVYVNDNWIGTAVFSTQKRQMNEGADPAGVDVWQVSRYVRAHGDAYETTGPDIPSHVKKLWISDDLTDAAYNEVMSLPPSQQKLAWRPALTAPDVGFGSCTDNVSFNVGITGGGFSFTPRDCDEYDVWEGRVGHYRIYYDQGAVSSAGDRDLAYTAGFNINDGIGPDMTWYGFATFRLGNLDGDSEFKCTTDEKGAKNSELVGSCPF